MRALGFRFEPHEGGLRVRPPRSRTLALLIIAAWNVFGFWMMQNTPLRFLSLAATVIFLGLAWWQRAPAFLRVERGLLVCRTSPFRRELTTPLADIDEVLCTPSGEPPTIEVVLQLVSGLRRPLPLPLDSLVVTTTGGMVVVDGRAKATAVEALAVALREQVDDARRRSVDYRRIAAGPDAPTAMFGDDEREAERERAAVRPR